MGQSSAVKAQELANAANLQMNQENNQLQRDLASEANEWNRENLRMQNTWNIEQWERENAYNDPSAQMERYIKAGINPIWALGNGDPGNAQHLESGTPASAVVADTKPGHVEAAYDRNLGAVLQGLVGIANNTSNSAQGFLKLALEAEDVKTRRSAQQSQAALNAAEALYKRSQTTGQDLFNNLTIDTYGSVVGIKAAEYDRLLAQVENTKEDSELKHSQIELMNAQRDQIIAQTDFISKQATALQESVKQKWEELSILRQNANTQEFSVGSESYYKGENLKLAYKEYNLQVQEAEKRFQNMDNQVIISYLDKSKGYFQKLVGVPQGQEINVLGLTSISTSTRNIAAEAAAAGIVLKNRVDFSPTQDNVKSYNEYLQYLYSLDRTLTSPQQFMPVIESNSPFNVLNPSDY